MPNYNLSTRGRIADIHYGLRTDATVNPIANGQNAVFTVTGRVLLVDLIGIVTEQIQAAATLLHWDFDAAATNPGGDAPLCIDSADLTGDVVGTMYALPAAAGTALQVPAGAYLRLFPAVGWILGAGELDLHASAARTGGILWSAYYIPLEEGAAINAA
jgi:hypothetical protein